MKRARRTVEQLLGLEGDQSLEDSVANTTSAESSDDLGFEVVRILCNSSDLQSSSRSAESLFEAIDPTHIPVAGHDLLVSGDKVANEQEDGHDDMLSHRDDIRSSDLLRLSRVSDR